MPFFLPQVLYIELYRKNAKIPPPSKFILIGHPSPYMKFCYPLPLMYVVPLACSRIQCVCSRITACQIIDVNFTWYAVALALFIWVVTRLICSTARFIKLPSLQCFERIKRVRCDYTRIGCDCKLGALCYDQSSPFLV